MKTNFFEQVAGLQINGNLQINIQSNDIGTLAVTVLLANQNPKITQGKNIPPMLLKGTSQELDEDFFGQISEPVKQTVKTFTWKATILAGMATLLMRIPYRLRK